jgi:polyisoprenoid-binding protein YceI
MQFIPTKFRRILWLPLVTAVVGNASPVVMDIARSHVEIAVKATIGSFVAQLQMFDPIVTATPQTGQIESAVFKSNFAAIKTGNADRDRDMNDWQQTDKFPYVVFTLTALEPAPSGKSIARGQLRFHGVERSVSFPISIETAAQIIAIDGDVTIDTREFGLPVISKYYFLKVDPIVHLHFHLQGKLADS